MQNAPLYIVDIIGEVVAATDAALFAVGASNAVKTAGKHINYLYGRGDQIIAKLLSKDSSPTLKNLKYPLIALVQDFPESRGNAGGYYASVIFPSILICTLTNSTDEVPKRYAQTFKPVLYPIYYEFLEQIAKHKANAGSADANEIVHTKYDRPGTPPLDDKGKARTDFTDYLDIIELQGVEVFFNQTIIC